jgi:hypothetical protein
VRKSTVHHGDDLQTGFRGFEITVFRKSEENLWEIGLQEVLILFGMKFQ